MFIASSLTASFSLRNTKSIFVGVFGSKRSDAVNDQVAVNSRRSSVATTFSTRS